MPSESSHDRQVWEQFLEHCPPYALEGLWSRLPASSRARLPPMNAAVALQSLLRQLSDEELRQSGVAVVGQDNTLVLDPRLTDPDGAIVPLRHEANEPPFELVTGGGCVLGRRLPACAVLHDAEYQRAIEACSNTLCVAFSMADVAVMLSLNIPAVPATGLDLVGGPELDDLCVCFGLQRSHSAQRPASSRSTRGPDDGPVDAKATMKQKLAELNAKHEVDGGTTTAPELMYLGWSPSQLSLSPPERLEQVIAHFQGLHKHLEIAMDDVHLWEPTKAEVDRVRFCVQYGSPDELRQALLASMEHSAGTMVYYRQNAEEKRQAPTDYLSALAQLQHALRDSKDKEDQQEAWKAFERLLEQDLVAPLVRQAMAAEPLPRNLMVQAANLSRLLQTQGIALAEKLLQAARQSGPQGIGLLPQAEMQQFVVMTDRQLALIRESHQCHKNPAHLPTRSPIPSKPRTPSPGLALALKR